MSYCFDFFRKFKKEGNFCGLDKSQVSRLTAYLEIVEALIKQKIPEEQIYENFTVSAATPLIAAKGDAHTEGLNFVTAKLKAGKKITNNDIQSTLKSCSTTTSPTKREPKKESKPYNGGTPQPGDYKDQEVVPPAAPIAAQMKEKYTPVVNKPPSPEPQIRKEEMKAAAANQLPAPITDTAGQVSQTTDTPPCKTGKPCPGGRNYLIKQPLLGNKCDQTGSLVANLSYCPIIQRQKAAAVNGAIFTTGGQVKAVDERVSSVIPRVAQNQPMALTIKFTAKQWAVLKQIVREGQADTLEEAVLFLVDEAGERWVAL